MVSLLYFLRKILHLKRLLLYCLAHKLSYGFIGKSCCERIHRLQAVKDFPVCRRRKDFRVFHLKLSLFSRNTASEYKNTALFQRIFQIWHIKPGDSDFFRGICCRNRNNLKISYFIYIHTRYDRSLNTRNAPFFQFLNGNRFFIRFIITRIIPEQFFCGGNSDFLKELFCFFSYSF